MNELKRTIDEATSILILLPDSASDKDYLAALQIQRIAQEKIRIVAPETKELEWLEVFGNPIQKKEFAITIDTTLSPIEELRYQKDGSNLTIFLTHTHSFNPQAIHMSEHLPAADLIITIGFSSQHDADVAIEQLPRKGTTRHIWIDENHKNSKSTKKLSPTSAGLLGRLMVRSREDKNTETLWTFITRDDFNRTGSTPAEIPSLIETFSHIAAIPRVAAIFWQYEENAGTEGILWTSDPAILNQLRKTLASNEHDSQFISLGHFSNFIEAETKTRKLLHELS